MLFDANPVPMWVTDREASEFLDVNDAALRAYGYVREEFLASTPTEIMKKDGTRAAAGTAVREVVFGGRQALLSVITGGTEGAGVTERTGTREEPRGSDGLLQSIVDNSSDIIYSTSVDGRFTFASPALTRVLGHDVRDVIGQSFTSFLHPDDVSTAWKKLQRLVTTGGTEREFEYRVRHADGSWRWHLSVLTPVVGPEGRIDHIVGIATDVTEGREAQLARRRTQEKFTKVFYTSPDAVDIARLEDGLYLEVNRGFTAIIGYSEEEAVGHTSIELGIWVDPAERGRLVREMSERGEVRNLEVRFRRKSGEIGTGLTSATLIEIDGRTCLLSFTRDITARKLMDLENEERRVFLERVLDAAPDAVIIADTSHRIKGWNPGAERLFGYPAAEALGRSADELLTGSDPKIFREAASWSRLVGPGAGVHGNETIRYRKDKVPVHVMVSMAPIEVGDELIGVVSIYTDITALKKAEEAVGKMNVELERRVQQRTEELRATNRELEAFAYSVSHDLRAPLRSVEGFSRALEEDCGDQLGPVGRDHLARVRAAARRMGELIDGLLSLSRITRAELSRELVDLAPMAGQIASELARRDTGRVVSFVMPERAEAYGDRRLLRAALENLMENAWKFTGRRETPVIELGMCLRDGQTAFFVRDNGVGFDMAFAGKLFNVFERLHRPDDFPGIGLGLANVQRIIHRHGGKVWAEARPDEGATFWFTLPPASPAAGR
jgi:PAS domain S-box-containing protein